MLIAWVLIFSGASHCLSVLQVSELSLIFFFFFPLLGERDAEILYFHMLTSWMLPCFAFYR